MIVPDIINQNSLNLAEVIHITVASLMAHAPPWMTPYYYLIQLINPLSVVPTSWSNWQYTFRTHLVFWHTLCDGVWLTCDDDRVILCLGKYVSIWNNEVIRTALRFWYLYVFGRMNSPRCATLHSKLFIMLNFIVNLYKVCTRWRTNTTLTYPSKAVCFTSLGVSRLTWFTITDHPVSAIRCVLVQLGLPPLEPE